MPEQLTVMLRVLPAVSRHRKTEGTFWHAMFLYVLNNSLTFENFPVVRNEHVGPELYLRTYLLVRESERLHVYQASTKNSHRADRPVG